MWWFGEQRIQGRLRCYSVLSREARRILRLVAIPPTGTLTFLFTDIEGSTRLWENNAPAMQLALARPEEILREAIEKRGGYVFKTVGERAGMSLAAPVIAAKPKRLTRQDR
jgi:class 3 adenylate cyclase